MVAFKNFHNILNATFFTTSLVSAVGKGSGHGYGYGFGMNGNIVEAKHSFSIVHFFDFFGIHWTMYVELLQLNKNDMGILFRHTKLDIFCDELVDCNILNGQI